VVVLEEALAFG